MKNLRTTCEGAILVSLALVFGILLKIPMLGNGGSLSLAMVPLVIFALRHGPVYGISAGMVFGLLKCAFGSGLTWGLPSVMLDYVLAYGMVGIAGFFGGLKLKDVPLGAVIGTLAGCLGRFLIHFISGVTIYAITTATELNGVVYTGAFVYSLVYNGLYMIPDTVLTVAVTVILAGALDKTPYPAHRVK